MPPARRMGPPAKPKNVKATFSRILKYLVGQNKLLLVLVLLLVVASSAAQVVGASMLKPLIDD